MKKVELFQAEDGSLFPSQEECRMHERARNSATQWAEAINEFMESSHNLYKSVGQSTMARKSIAAWEGFKAIQEAEYKKAMDVEMNFRE